MLCCCAGDPNAEQMTVEAQQASIGTDSFGLPADHDENAELPPQFAEPPASVGTDTFGLPADHDEVAAPPPAAAEPPQSALRPTVDVNEDIFEFDATIEKPGGEKLGLDISAYDGKTLLVGRVKDGPVERWNSEQGGNYDTQIQRGDRITVINGKTGDSDELLSAARVDVLRCRVRRLVEFTVMLCPKTGGEAVNVDFDDSLEGHVIVQRVVDGLASRTNKRNTADLEIRQGDKVISVNGTEVTTAQECKKATSIVGDVEFRLRRPASKTTLPK